MENVTNDPDACSTSTSLLRAEIRKAFTLITGKWKLEILWLLNQRIHRFGELKRSIPGITQHMLTTQLRELEADGLISRTLFAEVPPRAEYALTARAKALKPVMDALLAWWRQYGKGAPAPRIGGRPAAATPKRRMKAASERTMN